MPEARARAVLIRQIDEQGPAARRPKLGCSASPTQDPIRTDLDGDSQIKRNFADPNPGELVNRINTQHCDLRIRKNAPASNPYE